MPDEITNISPYLRGRNPKSAPPMPESPSQPAPLPPRRLPGFHAPWRKTTLGEIATIQGGGTPPTTNPDYWGGNIPWYTLADFKQGRYVGPSQRTITEHALSHSKAKLIPPSSILLSTTATIGELAITAEACACNQQLSALILDQNRNCSDFIYCLLQTHKADLMRMASGTAFPRIRVADLSALPLLLPPTLQEQRTIADVLVRAEGLAHAASGRYARLQQAYQLLYQGLLQQLLPGPARP